MLELLDANGAAFASYRYDAWGLPRGSGSHSTGVWTQTTGLITTSTLAGQIASRQVLRYAGYACDAESGLYYCSARYYDPATRQWTTGDPAKADAEESAYQYCAGEPLSAVDSSGCWMLYCCTLWGDNGRGDETESWYWFRQWPDTTRTLTTDGVAEFFRVGVRNKSAKGRWVTWQALCCKKKVLWMRDWDTKSLKRFIPARRTKTFKVKWLSLDLMGTKIRTWGWGASRIDPARRMMTNATGSSFSRPLPSRRASHRSRLGSAPEPG